MPASFGAVTSKILVACDWRNTLAVDPIEPDANGNYLTDEVKQSWQKLLDNNFIPWILSYTGKEAKYFREQIESGRKEIAALC